MVVDEAGFDGLMQAQRDRARGASAAKGGGADDSTLVSLAGAAPAAKFVGYEKLSAETSLTALAPDAADEGGSVLVKLEESPFYAEGGGQVSDSGVLRWDGGEAKVTGVHRVGDDQALRLAKAPEGLTPGTHVTAEVARSERHAIMCNHTATHLLHAALRERLGTHVRQAGSAVRPDKLRFDFTHGAGLSPEDMAAVEDRVNGWIKDGAPVRAMQMAKAEAEALGAMALFGEKYGEWVRMVEVDGISRELCGGTHVANTAEVGIFKISSEGSSAANVRRIEALTGPAAIDWFRQAAHERDQVAQLLGGPDPVAAATKAAESLADAKRAAKQAGAADIGRKAEEMSAAGSEIDGVLVFVGHDPDSDSKSLASLADRIMQGSPEAAVVLGSADGGKVALVASFSDGVVRRGLKASDVIKGAAALVGGGGGGRDNVAQAGGKDESKLDEALETARAAIESGLRG